MTIERDCIEYVTKCHKYQVYSDKINEAPTPQIQFDISIAIYNMGNQCNWAYQSKSQQQTSV
jgi:hypothetical protein